MHSDFRAHLAAYLMTYVREWSTREVLISAADIFIVYYVIYRILKLIRGTRAAQMLTGMLLVAGFFAAAKRFELTTVSWLFENLINYFIIFLIVIFQHDIRRGLMQVGQNLFRRRQYEETYVIEEVVQAADELSRHRIGGLIVLERDAELVDYLGEAGIELDAKVTKELLVTLFIPDADNHMHDGAVIIKNLRIQQAGAVLPLSANAKLDKQLGTRHRAAIGVTEETDAVVVVVSEERGTVSLCFNGNIARDLAPPTLRKALLGLFQKKKAKTRPPGKGEARPKDGAQSQESTQAREPLPAELMSLVATQPMQRPRTDSPSVEGEPAPSATSRPPEIELRPQARASTPPLVRPPVDLLRSSPGVMRTEGWTMPGDLASVGRATPTIGSAGLQDAGRGTPPQGSAGPAPGEDAPARSAMTLGTLVPPADDDGAQRGVALAKVADDAKALEVPPALSDEARPPPSVPDKEPPKSAQSLEGP